MELLRDVPSSPGNITGAGYTARLSSYCWPGSRIIACVRRIFLHPEINFPYLIIIPPAPPPCYLGKIQRASGQPATLVAVVKHGIFLGVCVLAQLPCHFRVSPHPASHCLLPPHSTTPHYASAHLQPVLIASPSALKLYSARRPHFLLRQPAVPCCVFAPHYPLLMRNCQRREAFPRTVYRLTRLCPGSWMVVATSSRPLPRHAHVGLARLATVPSVCRPKVATSARTAFCSPGRPTAGRRDTSSAVI
ncbi:hypothetical protein KCP69_18295 [Salmonella enterica subsp. enterica]|nr:hypothetical protein KCP69_18295 [Salmonella enterica subsp. enterica]